ncbi:hypothetical protein CYMTET_35912 [Cymbomonas tetramitiformis]|uniref:Polycystin cation channel PKD1/PKD2 domain-containing protein n=1 Tax=Cymbomonas tetramitiformis TaxID=36881 RepID=A0AAE0F8B1_9CHLO|nr:hypothetical protein CYMTET_35912 [Cymbomonas tetramitiformis]
MLFGRIMHEFSDISRASKTLIQMITIETGMERMNEADRFFGPLYYGLFITIVFFLLVNVLLAILMNSYSSLAEENRRAEKQSQKDLTVSIFREFFLQGKFYLYWTISKVRSSPKAVPRDVLGWCDIRQPGSVARLRPSTPPALFSFCSTGNITGHLGPSKKDILDRRMSSCKGTWADGAFSSVSVIMWSASRPRVFH